MMFVALTPRELAQVEQLKAEKYDTWEWNYGRSPEFGMTCRRYWDGGCLETGVSVAHGCITDIRFSGDFLAVSSMEPLVKALRGVPFRREDVRRVLDGAGVVWQMAELGKVDAGGGGTVAQYMANRNITTIDAGVPVLSMHSPFETVGKLDCYMNYLGCMAVYNA